MAKFTDDLEVKGLLYPGSYTAAQITTLNGSATNDGAIVYNNTDQRAEIGVGSNFVPIANNFKSLTITTNTTLGATLVPLQGVLYRFNLNPNIIITPDVGSEFVVFDYSTRTYVSRGVNTPYTNGSFFSTYDVERYIVSLVPTYYIKQVETPRTSLLLHTNNAADSAINFGTVAGANIRCAVQVISSIDSKYSITLNTATGIYTTNYNGFVEFTYTINYASGTANASMATSVRNITTNVISGNTAIKSVNATSTNIFTTSTSTIMACAVGNTFAVQGARLGTTIATVTMTTARLSQIRVKAIIL